MKRVFNIFGQTSNLWLMSNLVYGSFAVANWTTCRLFCTHPRIHETSGCWIEIERSRFELHDFYFK